MKRIALIGSKEFAQQFRWYIKYANEYEVVGYFDDFENKGKIINNLPILGKISDVEYAFNEGLFDGIFFAAGYQNFDFRESTYNKLKGKVPFLNIIDPTSIISKTAIIGEGVCILGNCFIGEETKIGNNVFIHPDCSIAHNCEIGDNSYLSGRDYIAGFTSLGKQIFLGLSVCVSDHVIITDNVWVGIGCVVAKDILEPGKYMTPSAKLFRIE